MRVSRKIDEYQYEKDYDEFITNRKLYTNMSPIYDCKKNEYRGWRYTRTVNSGEYNESLTITGYRLDETMKRGKEMSAIFDSLETKRERFEFIRWYKTNKRAIKSGEMSPEAFRIAPDERYIISIAFNTKKEADYYRNFIEQNLGEGATIL